MACVTSTHLDVTDEVVRQKVLGVKLPAEMKKLFDQA